MNLKKGKILESQEIKIGGESIIVYLVEMEFKRYFCMRGIKTEKHIRLYAEFKDKQNIDKKINERIRKKFNLK